MKLADVTTIKNRLDEIIEHEKDEIVALEDLIIFCESAGAIKTVSTLKNMLQHEKNEIISLKDLVKHFENEENRLMSISPELRYPFVSERYGYGQQGVREPRARVGAGVREGIERQYRGYMVRNTGDMYRGYSVRDRGNRTRY
jgi:hypothetical protein